MQLLLLLVAVLVGVAVGVTAALAIAGAVRPPPAAQPPVDPAVAAVGTQLQHVVDLVAALQTDRAAQHGELLTRLSEASRQSQALAETTQSLRMSLASPKARGQWGERMADDVLRMAGLVEGVNYLRQTSVAGGGIPDVTFLLPGQRVLHMDVKFPIDNYLRAIEADQADASRAAAKAFLRDVHQRIREITTRAYIDPDTTVDYVLLFIPNESVYSFMHEHDPGLIDAALSRQVVLCSPFTLFAMLAVIRQAMDSFRLEQVGDEILQCLGGFSLQWHKFSDQVDLVARRLESAQRAYDDLAGTRRKALQRTIDQVDELRTRRGLEGPADPPGDPFAEPLAMRHPA
ncbi:MAG: DNA recombination protein RmuC [Acidimicrobiales bacterium]